jgi:hypothetical protein
MEGCVYTIYQNNEGNRFYIFRKEKDGNSNQLRVAFKSAEDAKAWVDNVLIPAWQNWHDCNKLAGQVYLDDPDELNETKNINENMKKQTIKLNESQLRKMIKESIKNILRESVEDEALNFVQSVNLDELIQNGKTYTEYGEGFYISRSSNRRDAILELTINGDNGYGHARVGLAGDLEEDYQYALSLAYEDYLTSNQPS